MCLNDIIESTNGFAIIYKFTSPSGKSYIGQSTNFSGRYDFFGKITKGDKGKKLYNALVKYGGFINFKLDILSKIELTKPLKELKKVLDKLEVWYISKYNTYYNGYNMTTGGGHGYVKVVSQEQKDYLSKLYTGTKRPEKCVERIEILCPRCGVEFLITQADYDLRIVNNKCGKICCSRNCGAKAPRPRTKKPKNK